MDDDDDEEDDDDNVYAASPGAAGAGEEAVVDWRYEEKLFDERHYFTGLLWNVQMYIDGYCPDYQYAYRSVGNLREGGRAMQWR